MDLVAQGAGRDRDRNGPGRLADEPIRAREEHVPAVQHLLHLDPFQGHHAR